MVAAHWEAHSLVNCGVSSLEISGFIMSPVIGESTPELILRFLVAIWLRLDAIMVWPIKRPFVVGIRSLFLSPKRA